MQLLVASTPFFQRSTFKWTESKFGRSFPLEIPLFKTKVNHHIKSVIKSLRTNECAAVSRNLFQWIWITLWVCQTTTICSFYGHAGSLCLPFFCFICLFLLFLLHTVKQCRHNHIPTICCVIQVSVMIKPNTEKIQSNTEREKIPPKIYDSCSCSANIFSLVLEQQIYTIN